jgi:hypothetical protein
VSVNPGQIHDPRNTGTSQAQLRNYVDDPTVAGRVDAAIDLAQRAFEDAHGVRSAVIPILECPGRSETTFRLTPASNTSGRGSARVGDRDPRILG